MLKVCIAIHVRTAVPCLHSNECRVDDLNRLGVHHDWELRTWSREFGVSADELRAVINAVGDRVGALRQYLDQRKK